MIVDGLVNLLMGLLSPILQLLPVADVAGWLPEPTDVANYVGMADTWVPIREPLLFIAQLLEWGQLFIPVALFVWVWKLIPGKMS